MVLPENVVSCDAAEVAAICLGKTIFFHDLAKIFFPGRGNEEIEFRTSDMLNLAGLRQKAIPETYPFEVTDRSIRFKSHSSFNAYTFMLLGRALDFGGPPNLDYLQYYFRRFFEDVVSWSLRKAGFSVAVLSIPRDYRFLPRSLTPALREISRHLGEAATLRPEAVIPADNDLAVDVIASPVKGNSTVGGWPTFQIQCATGAITELEAKLSGGAGTFATVWDDGFFRASSIRAVATPDDLLTLQKAYWNRLGQGGWVIDRTRIAHLSGYGSRTIPLLREVREYWEDLWAARLDIDWRNAVSD
jgi:hypothetical protein